jgi:tetratricopeptide (TPR) repeat protein
MRGQNYVRLKDHAKAVEDLNRALEFKLGSKAEEANACNSLAWIYVAGPAEFRAPDKALPLAQKAVEQAPDNRAYCHTLGVVYYRLVQYKEAVDALERGVKSNKDQATAFDLYFLAMCHHRLGDTGKAKECYDRAVAWQKQAKLTVQQVEELNAFRAEADMVLKEAKL